MEVALQARIRELEDQVASQKAEVIANKQIYLQQV